MRVNANIMIVRDSVFQLGLGTWIKDFWTVYFTTFWPSTLVLSNHPLCYFWSVHFDPWPSSLAQKTVHFCATVHCGPDHHFIRSVYQNGQLWIYNFGIPLAFEDSYCLSHNLYFLWFLNDRILSFINDPNYILKIVHFCIPIAKKAINSQKWSILVFCSA